MTEKLEKLYQQKSRIETVLRHYESILFVDPKDEKAMTAHADLTEKKVKIEKEITILENGKQENGKQDNEV